MIINQIAAGGGGAEVVTGSISPVASGENPQSTITITIPEIAGKENVILLHTKAEYERANSNKISSNTAMFYTFMNDELNAYNFEYAGGSFYFGLDNIYKSKRSYDKTTGTLTLTNSYQGMVGAGTYTYYAW